MLVTAQDHKRPLANQENQVLRGLPRHENQENEPTHKQHAQMRIDTQPTRPTDSDSESGDSDESSDESGLEIDTRGIKRPADDQWSYDSDVDQPPNSRAKNELNLVLSEMASQEFAERYHLLKKVGEGTFSSVYKAIDLKREDYEEASNFYPLQKCGIDASKLDVVHVALKRVYETSSAKRVQAELKFLYDLKDSPCVVPVISFERYKSGTLIVLPYFEHTEFRELMVVLCEDLERVKHYMIQLFFAMRSVHRAKILHRDVKPSNFMYNITQERGFLTDFGLAQDFEEKRPQDQEPPVLPEVFNSKVEKLAATQSVNKVVTKAGDYVVRTMGRAMKDDKRPSRKANRAGTRGFRAPEVLFKVSYQTPAIDIWSCGVILLCVFTEKFPFFHSTDDNEAVLELISLFGPEAMVGIAARHGKYLVEEVLIALGVNLEFGNIEIPRNSKAKHYGLEGTVKKMSGSAKFQDIKDSGGFELLKRCLELIPEDRITAEEAIHHPFFDSVRSRYRNYL